MRETLLLAALVLPTAATAAEFNGWARAAFEDLTPADAAGRLDAPLSPRLSFGGAEIMLEETSIAAAAAALGTTIQSAEVADEVVFWACTVLIVEPEALRLSVVADSVSGGPELRIGLYSIEPADAAADAAAGCGETTRVDALPEIPAALPGVLVDGLVALFGPVTTDGSGGVTYVWEPAADAGPPFVLQQLRYRMRGGVAEALSFSQVTWR